MDPFEPTDSLDDRLDALVADYSDRLARGAAPDRDAVLAEVPPAARPGLERCLKMIEAGLATAPSPATVLVPGLELDQYRLVREIGRGGMALVWLAQDTRLSRPVALKVLRPGLLAIARLRHAHVVQIHGVGHAHGFHYLAMEYVEGPSLSTVLGALPAGHRTAEDLARATGIPSLAGTGVSFEVALARLLAPVADALGAAHDAGLVHRDVKPSNILIHRDGRAVVADFGLAKGAGDPALSLTGDALGTPYYMSPEQAYVTGHEVDHRTDVYSLGVTLFEALSGRRPFGGESVLEVIEAIRTQLPRSLRTAAYKPSRDLAAVVRRAMAREPRDRYGSAQDLAADLVAFAEGRPTLALRAAGGPLRRGLAQLRFFYSGVNYEYRSERTFLGLPLVHICGGRRNPGQGRRVAKGWFAVGDTAIGGIACGQLSFGGVACGGLGMGLLFGWGGIASGLLAFGGIALGGMIAGGIAVGWLAFGGIAVGYAAVGGFARGVYAAGGDAKGSHVIDQSGSDPAAEEWFERLDAVLPFGSWVWGG
jgi:hypothetical protein